MDPYVREQELAHTQPFFISRESRGRPLIFESSNIVYVNMPQEDIMGVPVVYRFVPKKKTWKGMLKKWWKKIW